MELRSSQRCGICYDHVNNSVSPHCCKHHFCLPCLRTWAQLNGTCPECRQPFDAIVSMHGYTVEPHAAQVTLRIFEEDSGKLLFIMQVHSSWQREEIIRVLNGGVEYAEARAILAQSRT